MTNPRVHMLLGYAVGMMEHDPDFGRKSTDPRCLMFWQEFDEYMADQKEARNA